MVNRIQKKEFVQRLAQRMETDEKTASAWLDGMTDEIFEALRTGESVTLPNFGSFYLRQARSGTIFKFNPSQKLRALFGWSSSYKGDF